MDHRKGQGKRLVNYKDSVQIFSHLSLPRSANIVSSHHFFSVKYDGEGGKAEVPHRNKDDLNNEIRSDSSAAQFAIIGTVLSTATLHKLKIVTLDISKAYL